MLNGLQEDNLRSSCSPDRSDAVQSDGQGGLVGGSAQAGELDRSALDHVVLAEAKAAR